MSSWFSTPEEPLSFYLTLNPPRPGDSYMVASGLFSEAEDMSPGGTMMRRLGGRDVLHAQKALDFARAMLEAASALLDPLGRPVAVRVGLHSGPCVSGVVGQRMVRGGARDKGGVRQGWMSA